MLRLPRFPLVALGAAALSLAACDAADPDADLSGDALDDAAVVVASALALDGGGALEDAAAGASLAASVSADGRSAGPDRPGCDNSRTFDEAASVWTVTIDCERGDPAGRFYATFDRTSTYQFFDADGDPQRERADASALDYNVLSGSSRFQSPRGTHALTSLGVDFTVDDLDGDLVTVNGTYQRAATDTLRGPRGERTVTYTLDAELDDVQGPKARLRRWRTAVSGTITGRLQATITRTPTDGPAVVTEVDRTFTITFPEDGGERIAEITIDRRRYRADIDTGEIVG